MRYYVIILTVILSTTPLFSKPSYHPAYTKFRDTAYLHTISIAQLKKLYLITLKEVKNSAEEDKEKFTTLAKIEFLMGTYYEFAIGDNYKIIIDVTQFNPKKGYNKLKRTKDAIFHFNRSIKYSNNAMKNGEFSDALTIRSNAAGQLCILKGIFYTLTHGLGVLNDSSKARRLDKNNGKALLLYASTKAYPPPIYFGNADHAIKLLNLTLSKPNLEKDDYFNIYLSMGLSYAKKKMNKKAIHWLNKSLHIYPSNKIAKELQRQVTLNIYKR